MSNGILLNIPALSYWIWCLFDSFLIFIALIISSYKLSCGFGIELDSFNDFFISVSSALSGSKSAICSTMSNITGDPTIETLSVIKSLICLSSEGEIRFVFVIDIFARSDCGYNGGNRTPITTRKQ